MRVLVACEFSGRVRGAFLARGHDAWSCDLLPTESPGPHIQGDVLEHLNDGWDLMIAHPPCTYLSKAGAHLWKQRGQEAAQATAFVIQLYEAPIARVAIENPEGQLTRLWRPPSQRIQPYAFGDPWTKQTCLWLRNLPPLWCSNIVRPWPSIPRRTSPAGDHWTYGAFMRTHRSSRSRSRTFPGIAAAMAEQWGVWPCV